jgi:hypothetical protein
MTGRRQPWVILLQSYNCLPSSMYLNRNVLYYHHTDMPWNSIWSSKVNKNWSKLIHIYSSKKQSRQTNRSAYYVGTRP